MSSHVQDTRDCVVVRSDEATAGRQGLDVFAGISAESAGAEAICMHLVVIPPGGRAHAHRHAGHETAIYIVQGRAEMRYGERLEKTLSVGPGDFLHIPAGMPHLPSNPSETEPCLGLLARTDPNEQESIELLPWLE
jgi:uncharacterized RmlC-like cupin family protein